ncbi:hypothetical protein G6F68_013847 [Rhizopus microsporus]|nr:hypothetical protein G6F68_013847 [Rhizopus microsporus]
MAQRQAGLGIGPIADATPAALLQRAQHRRQLLQQVLVFGGRPPGPAHAAHRAPPQWRRDRHGRQRLAGDMGTARGTEETPCSARARPASVALLSAIVTRRVMKQPRLNGARPLDPGGPMAGIASPRSCRGGTFASTEALKMLDIVLGEDDARLGTMVSDYLQRHGYQVAHERSGERAVNRILAEKPALVLLDVGLPDQDGFEVCRQIRPHYDGIICVLTARTASIRSEARRGG